MREIYSTGSSWGLLILPCDYVLGFGALAINTPVGQTGVICLKSNFSVNAAKGQNAIRVGIMDSGEIVAYGTDGKLAKVQGNWPVEAGFIDIN